MADDLHDRLYTAIDTDPLTVIGIVETELAAKDAEIERRTRQRDEAREARGHQLARAEAQRLRYERRLLGAARMVLDLIAAGAPDQWDRIRDGAEDVAQRIVDEIGHPVTDELVDTDPIRLRDEAFAFLHRAERAEAILRDLADPDPCRFDHHGYCQAHGWMDPEGCPHARARDLLAALDTPAPAEGDAPEESAPGLVVHPDGAVSLQCCPDHYPMIVCGRCGRDIDIAVVRPAEPAIDPAPTEGAP